VNRRDFQRLARVRLQDARVLLARRRYDAAYYLAGYAVECALKACIAKQTRRFDFPPRAIQDIYTHDLERLIRGADLADELRREIQAERLFEANWAKVLDWTEESRYQRTSAADALGFVQAIADPQHGVLQWLETWW
jgi:HEPN domain-containing protein